MQIKVVISAHNDASKPYNITAVMGSLNSPMDFDLYIQNFTQQVRGTSQQQQSKGLAWYALYITKAHDNLCQSDMVVTAGMCLIFHHDLADHPWVFLGTLAMPTVRGIAESVKCNQTEETGLPSTAMPTVQSVSESV